MEQTERSETSARTFRTPECRQKERIEHEATLCLSTGLELFLRSSRTSLVNLSNQLLTHCEVNTRNAQFPSYMFRLLLGCHYQGVYANTSSAFVWSNK
jgi:hypothetical protein